MTGARLRAKVPSRAGWLRISCTRVYGDRAPVPERAHGRRGSRYREAGGRLIACWMSLTPSCHWPGTERTRRLGERFAVPIATLLVTLGAAPRHPRADARRDHHLGRRRADRQLVGRAELVDEHRSGCGRYRRLQCDQREAGGDRARQRERRRRPGRCQRTAASITQGAGRTITVGRSGLDAVRLVVHRQRGRDHRERPVLVVRRHIHEHDRDAVAGR